MERKIILFIGLLLAILLIASCAKKNAVGPDNANLPEVNLPSNFGTPVPIDSARTVEPADTMVPPVLAKIGAAIGVAWPFGRSENPSLWSYGEGSSKTPGGTIFACGAWINSHTGADYNARDMRRKDVTSYGKNIYAGISGKVVKAGDCGGYGYCVVIYDASRHVAVRYAHDIPMCIVGVGQYVSVGQLIAKLGDSGNAAGSPHLHLVAYENVPTDQYGNPIIPSVCNSDWYACAVYFYCW